MVKSYDKAKKITENEGHFKQYIRAVSELEDYVVELWADTEWRQAASKNNATSLTKLRQRIRRYNKDYEKEIADFKANPDNYPEEEKILETKESESEKSADESESEASESDSDDSDDSEKPKKPRKKSPKDDDEDSDSEDWDLTESDESSSDEELDLNQEDIWKKFLKQG